MITYDELKRQLYYDTNTGHFTWIKLKVNNQVKVGDMAGSRNINGYWYIYIKGRSYKAHRLAWLYCYGVWPKDQIDHINTNKLDNRISNLREADNSKNNMNRGLRSDNTSGIKGVGLFKPTGKYHARGYKNGVRKSLGHYDTIEGAIAARDAFEKEYQGEYQYGI